MKNNYDLILNFEVVDGKPLLEEDVNKILKHAEILAKSLEGTFKLRVWKAIIAQGVESKRLG